MRQLSCHGEVSWFFTFRPIYLITALTYVLIWTIFCSCIFINCSTVILSYILRKKINNIKVIFLKDWNIWFLSFLLRRNLIFKVSVFCSTAYLIIWRLQVKGENPAPGDHKSSLKLFSSIECPSFILSHYWFGMIHKLQSLQKYSYRYNSQYS